MEGIVNIIHNLQCNGSAWGETLRGLVKFIDKLQCYGSAWAVTQGV
jgi:hypothetical protein